MKACQIKQRRIKHEETMSFSKSPQKYPNPQKQPYMIQCIESSLESDIFHFELEKPQQKL